MSFSPHFIEKVREANNIVDLIGQYTQLKRSGNNSMGLCPFPDHKEKSPSFSVREDRQFYHCFGCNKGGDIVTFLETFQGLSFPDAIEYLAKRAGIPLEKEERHGDKKDAASSLKDDKKQALQINELAKKYYQHCLEKWPVDHAHHAYFKVRGLNKEICATFQLGIAPGHWDSLVKVFDKRQISLATAESLGLVKRKQNGHFDIFRDRLMFPILSPLGETIGFGGRILGEGHPKYLNSPETSVFHKGKTFYGLHETARYIRAQDEAVVVEGYMDLIALYAVGIRNVVAVLGTALTEHHARLIKRYTKNVVVLMDGDEAGQRAAERSLPVLLSQGLYPRYLLLPGELDPDEFIKERGAEALQGAIAQAPEFFAALLNKKMEGFAGQAHEKVKLVDELGPLLESVSDPRLKTLYFSELQRRLRVDSEWLRQALRMVQTQPKAAHEEAVPKTPVLRNRHVISKAPKVEIQLLQLMLCSPESLEVALAAKIEGMVAPEIAEILQMLSERYGQVRENFDKLPALLASVIDEPSIVTGSIISTEGGVTEKEEAKMLADCLKRVKERFLKAKARQLAEHMSEQPSQEELERFMNIQRQTRAVDLKDD